MPTVTCQQCGNPFEARSRRAKVCWGPCYRAYENQRQKHRRAGWSDARRKASILTAAAIFRGDLIRQPCEVCGKRNVDAHHDDYARPLDVRWLCRSHHKIHHDQFGQAANG